jgi:hypothetical protein
LSPGVPWKGTDGCSVRRFSQSIYRHAFQRGKDGMPKNVKVISNDGNQPGGIHST